jgi:transcriptional regulator with XRE-family HTH domain
MEEVANRIQQIIKSREISNSEMADSIGLPRPILSHILSGRNKPSLAVIQKITETYSDIDVKWLLVGKESGSTGSDQSKLISHQKDTTIPPQQEKLGTQTLQAPENPKREIELMATAQNVTTVKNNEITQIVHYFADGTFKVFTPNA